MDVGLLSPIHPNPSAPYPVENIPCLARRISKHCVYNMVERSRRPFPPLSSTEHVPCLACRGRSRETTGYSQSNAFLSIRGVCGCWYLGSGSAGLFGKCLGDKKITGVNTQGDGIQYIDNIKGLDMILGQSEWKMLLILVLVEVGNLVFS